MSKFIGPHKYIVYLLHHPSSKSCYVGKSRSGLMRPRAHGQPSSLKCRGRFPVTRWVKKLISNGYQYEITVLEVVDNDEQLIAAEKRHIARLRDQGVTLLNVTDGGEGSPGYRHTAESRAKMSAAKKGKKPSPQATAALIIKNRSNKGRVVSPETRARISAAKVGKKLSPETRAKMSASRTGKKRTTPRPPMSAETKAKLSLAFKGRKHSPEARRKMSLSMKETWKTSIALRRMITERNADPEFQRSIKRTRRHA